jgi:aminoglycoside 2''-phosphotransferase
MQVRSCERLGEGAFFRAFLVNDSLVVREPKHRMAELALAREACLMPVLAPRLPVPVPQPRYLRPADPRGTALGVHDLVPGRELTHRRWAGLGEEDRWRLAESLGTFLSDLHRIDPLRAAGCGLGLVDQLGRAASLRELLHAPAAVRVPSRLRARADAALARVEAGVPAWRSRSPVLVHGDVSPEHVLVAGDPPALSGVIDWSDVQLGDPAFDFVYVYEDWGLPFLDLVLEAYRPERDADFRPRILLHHLVEHTGWLLGELEEGHRDDVALGFRVLERVLDDLDRQRG